MNEVVLTLDMDWAPDFVIDFVAERLVVHRVRATWFVTHLSPGVLRLKEHPDLFELGLHPNFLPGSTHGDTPEKVLQHCAALVPGAASLRTHGLYQSTHLLRQILIHTAVTTDVSLFLPHVPSLQPVEHQWRQRSLLRVPFFWEDDLEMERVSPWWDLGSLLAVGPGLKVLDFHPMHIYLNSLEIRSYRTLKQRLHSLSEADPEDLTPLVREGVGTQTLFMEVVRHLSVTAESACIKDVHSRWHEEKEGQDS